MAGAVLLVLGALGVQGARLDERQILNAERARAVLAGRTVHSAFMGMLSLKQERHELYPFIESLPAGEIVSVALYDRAGTLVAVGGQADAPSAAKTIARGEVVPEQPFERAGGHVLAVRLPVENKRVCQDCHGSAADVLGHIEVSLSRATAQAAIRWAQQREFITLAVVLAVVVLALVGASELFVLQPLRRLSETAKRVGDDPEELFEPESADELEAFASELNEVLMTFRQKIADLEAYHFETMRQAQKMATIGQLASALAHEIKNPMAGISGAMQVFMEDCPQDDPRREIVKEVQSEIERLDRAFKDLLSFARSHEPHPVKTTIGEILAPAVRLVANQAKKQKVHVNIEQPGGPASLYVDPEEMQQVFLNIMVDALNDMPDGGTLDIGVIVDEGQKEVNAYFTNSGGAVPEEDIEAAFDPAIVPGRSSRGLVLGIMRRLVEHNGGRLTVLNRETGGTTTTVFLPVKRDNV